MASRALLWVLGVLACIQGLARTPCGDPVFRLAGRPIFAVNMVLAVIVESLLCYPIVALEYCGVLKGGPRRFAAQVAKLFKGALFGVLFQLCPWIRVQIEQRALLHRVCETDRPVIFLANHTSFMDSIVLAGHLPWAMLRRHRLLADIRFMKTPVLGRLFQAEQHIAVAFAGTKVNDFKLEKGNAEQIAAAIDIAMEAKDCLILYPEGQINKINLRVLNTFRRGSFKAAVRHDAVLWGWVAINNTVCWPTNTQLGGSPADIICMPVELAPGGTRELLTSLGVALEAKEGGEEELLTQQAGAVAQACQERMQKVLDALYVKHDAAPATDSYQPLQAS